MTEKEMNKLADIIIDRLKQLQEKLDQQFFKSAEEAGLLLQMESAEFTQEKFKEEKIKRLEAELAKALDGEQYELAAALVEKINELKNED
jgi:excinuclease UvrABC helicase subunit UvrB